MTRITLRDCPVLITTSSRNAIYIPVVLDITKRHWPNHPIITIATDGGKLNGLLEEVITVQNANWVEVLLGALKRLRAKDQSPYVFLMLEDLCPIRPCDEKVIERALMHLDKSDSGMIAFSCFDVYDWVTSPIDSCDTFNVRAIPKDFTYYFSVQPSFWRLEYLIDACEAALNDGSTSPWAFEEMRWSAAKTHLITNYVWPASHHGFMFQGRPNRSAIAAMRSGVCADLRKQLIEDAFGGEARYLAWRAADRVKKMTAKGVARRLLGPLGARML